MTRSESWPWSQGAYRPDSVAERYRRVIALLSNVPVMGYETSVRLSPGGACWDRLLFGVERRLLPMRRLHCLVDALGMPWELKLHLFQGIESARELLIGFEGSEESTESRIYVGYGSAGDPDAPQVSLRGFKWQQGSDDPVPVIRITEYSRLPSSKTSDDAFVCALNGKTDPSAQLVARMLGMAAQAHASGRVEILAATESDSERASLCLRAANCDIRLKDLFSEVQALLAAWGLLDAGYAERLLAFSQRSIGWIATGVHGGGDPFITLYFEAGRNDVQSLIKAGAANA